MKYTPSIAFDEMSGSAKGVTAAKVRGRKYIRNRGTGGSTRTSQQSAVKSVFKQLSQAWKGLSNENILAWNALALTQAGKSVLGSSSKISGANLFMRLNYWVVFCGGTPLETPPTLSGVSAPSGATIALSADAMTFKLDETPSLSSDYVLVVMASAPQSNGITRAYSKAAIIGDPLEIDDKTYDIKADYDSHYGAPSAATPKVFLKWFIVNKATGEKSGEVYGMTKLA